MSNSNFLEKYGNDDFLAFRNHSVYIRSYENGGSNVCIMIYYKINGANCKAPYTLVLETNTGRLVETRNGIAINKTCNMDSLLAWKLASKLLEMKVYGIGVDSNGNVFVNTRFNEGQTADLVRFSEDKYRIGIYREDYKKIRENWYSR